MKPLLKWAGGKRQLLPALRPYSPEQFTRYLEPFLGSGAMFFDLLNAGRLDGRVARLVDVNPDLVGCYRAVRDHTDEVLRALQRLAAEHARRGDECYYEVRDQRFNPGRRSAEGAYTPELAAMLIYLNRTGFNGLFRMNRRGEFNVPVGRYAAPRICDETHLRGVAAALSHAQVSVDVGSFDTTLESAGAGDFVYCDPPYAPLSRTASFAHYTAGGFTALDQVRLQQAVIGACKRGAWVVLSNSSAPEILAAYESAEARRAGLVVHKIPARRAINSRADRRGTVEEVIVTNAARHRLRDIKPRMAPARAHPAARRIAS